jgi:hypothetical protein
MEVDTVAPEAKGVATRILEEMKTTAFDLKQQVASLKQRQHNAIMIQLLFRGLMQFLQLTVKILGVVEQFTIDVIVKRIDAAQQLITNIGSSRSMIADGFALCAHVQRTFTHHSIVRINFVFRLLISFADLCSGS